MTALTATPTTYTPRVIDRKCPRCELPTMHGAEGELCMHCDFDPSKAILVRRLESVLAIAIKGREAKILHNRKFAGEGWRSPFDIKTANRNIKRLRTKIKRCGG